MVGYSKEIQTKLHALGLGLPQKDKPPSRKIIRSTAFRTIETLFDPKSKLGWITGLQPIENPGRRRDTEIDFVLRFNPSFCVPFVNVHVITDEAHMQTYNGDNKAHGLTAAQVRELSLVYLNGTWATDSIIADLLAQVFSLKKFWGEEDKMHQTLSGLPKEIIAAYHSGYWPVEQHRARYFDWMNNGCHSSVVFVDKNGIRGSRN